MGRVWDPAVPSYAAEQRRTCAACGDRATAAYLREEGVVLYTCPCGLEWKLPPLDRQATERTK